MAKCKFLLSPEILLKNPILIESLSANLASKLSSFKLSGVFPHIYISFKQDIVFGDKVDFYGLPVLKTLIVWNNLPVSAIIWDDFYTDFPIQFREYFFLPNNFYKNHPISLNIDLFDIFTEYLLEYDKTDIENLINKSEPLPIWKLNCKSRLKAFFSNNASEPWLIHETIEAFKRNLDLEKVYGCVLANDF